MLVESVLLALTGGAAGMILSIWILDGLLFVQGSGSNGEIFLNSQPNLRVALFSFAASLFTALLFGIAPSIRGAGFAIVETLKENTAGIVGAGA